MKLKDLGDTRASRFDVHPSAMMHERMAQVLSQKIQEEWPDLFLRGEEQPQSDTSHG